MRTSQMIVVVASILVVSAIFYVVALHKPSSATAPSPITPPASKSITTVTYTSSDKKAQEANKSLIAANTGFSLKLLKELQAENEGKDIIISPLSVSTALAMTYNGANSSTRDAMASTLGLRGMSLAEVNRGYEDLMGSLVGADSNATVSMGNSVWVRDVFAPYVKENFTEAMSSYYGGGLYVRDFGPGTVQEING
jgi:serine protease inhibitor